MRISVKIFLGYLFITVIGFLVLQDWIISDVRKNYSEALEETMIDMSNVLACMASEQVVNNRLDTSAFELAMKSVLERKLSARIYRYTKERVEVRVYITDAKGIVIYDSDEYSQVGTNFSQWRNISYTLKGKYGARASRRVKDDPRSSVYHISAPIMTDDKLFGVMTVAKPVTSMTHFVNYARVKVIVQTAGAALLVLIMNIIISKWLTNPIKRLQSYVNGIREGKKVTYPKFRGKGEIAHLAESFEALREALEGKKYVEEYVNNLTHELKSPLSAIKGAIELLGEENLPEDQRLLFSANIKNETDRMRKIVDKMLQLSVLENRRSVDNVSEFDLINLCGDLVNSYRNRHNRTNIMFQSDLDSCLFSGDHLLIYQALDNLIVNAVDFVSSKDGLVLMTLEKNETGIVLSVADNGCGIPDYALPRIFDKFYSLPRPESKRKSSGLGLALVKQIVELHDGTITMDNRTEGGALATVTFIKK